MSVQQTSEALAPVTDELDGLDAQTLSRLERQKYRALAFLLFLFLFTLIGLFLQQNNASDQEGAALFSNGMYILSALIGAYWAFAVVYHARRVPQIFKPLHCVAWFLIGLGEIANGLGNLYYAWMQYIWHREPAVPSFADIGFTLSYMLILAGLLLLPHYARTWSRRIRIAIDALITTLCLLGISWSLLIGPLLIQMPPGELFQTITSISYPCWDLLLILALLLFIRQDVAPVMRVSLAICILSILAQVWADSGYAYLTNLGLYHSGMTLIDPFWILGNLLMGLAGLYQYTAVVRQNYRERVLSLQHAIHRSNQAFSRHFVIIQSCLLHIPFAALLIVTLSNQMDHMQTFALFLDILCAVTLLLIIIHYALVTYENTLLGREKEQHRLEAEMLRHATTSLSSLLETDCLLNQIVTICATELGFDAAAVVVIEEYDRPLDEQSTLLARAVTSAAHPVMAWQITGKTIPYCTALMGKEIEVSWADAPAHPVTLVHQWHIDHRIQETLFVPLVYQGETRGCLACSLRAARRFNPRECDLAEAFANEAARALEHAHLYELARENAAFAQAMANIAARLNSVVATGIGSGSEIQHLICTEGANALSADLAILYGYNQNNLFVPLAAVTDKPEPPTLPQEWPALSSDDYITQLVNSRQPALLEISRPIMTHLRPGLNTGRLPIWSLSPEQPFPGPQIPVPHAQAPTVHVASDAQIQTSSALQTALQRRYIHTAILAPLIIHQVPMGLLVLARVHRPGTVQRRSFASQDLAHAQDFASQASVAFTNARLYQQIHSAHQRMQELDQLKDQFMVTASHELRTPLTAVQGYLELLEQYHTTLSPTQRHEFLQKASRGCEELVLLLNNVMDASYLEIEAGIHQAHLQRVVVRDMVHNVVDLILPQVTQEHRALQIEISPHLVARADPTRLRQVMLNLSVNALKYSPSGSPLHFSACLAVTDTPVVIISLTDHGKGISARDQSRLFQRFVRLESDLNSTVRGSGLGLYISRRLIEAMKGKIWLESTGIPGQGTTFHVQLPIA